MSDDSEGSEEDSKRAYVLDNGTRRIKIGFAGDDAPRDVFLNMTGRLSNECPESPDVYVGDKAQQSREICSLDYPMEHGIVVDWDVMETMWAHAFSPDAYYNRGKNLDNIPVLLTEPPFNPKSNRETMAQVMFETFRRPAIDVVLTPFLAYLAHGRNTTLCVDIGDGVCSVYPTYEGYTPMAGVMRSDLAGRDMTDFLMNDMNVEQGLSLSTASDREIVYEIKEELCTAVSPEPEEQLSKHSQTYETKSGEVISVSNKVLSRCSEILFNPKRFGYRAPSVQQMVHDSLMNCDVDRRSLLANNIMLSGGTTMMMGFKERLKSELMMILPHGMKACIRDPPERSYSVWIGGSILASLGTHEVAWISKEMYEEFGPNVVFRRDHEVMHSSPLLYQ